MLNRSNLWVVTAWVLAPLGLVALSGCQEETQAPVVAQDLVESGADNVLYEMTHYMTRDGLREALLEADTAYSWQDSTAVSLRTLRLVVYDEVGNERAVVTADRGRLDPESRSMFAQGNVVLTVTADGRVVESEELNYDPNSNRIWSTQPTVSRQGSRVLEGTGFESDTEFTNIRVLNARTRGGVRF